MNLKTYVARLDDYSGELALNLETLEQARSHGSVDAARVLEFIEEVRRKAVQVDLNPWRSRSIACTLAGIALFVFHGVAAFVLPDLGESLGNWLDAAPVLGLFAFALAAWCLAVYAGRRKAELGWFRALESLVRQGRPLDGWW